MTALCRYCKANLHKRCTDVDAGTACACQCPSTAMSPEEKRQRAVSLTNRIRRMKSRLAAAEAELEELLTEDPLAAYRQPEDRYLGPIRLAEATKEMNSR